MDLGLLKTFYAVASLKSMKQAGEKVCLSSSAISKQIARLEKELGGIQLFDRTSTGVHLTQEGEIYLRYVKQVIEEAERIQASMAKEKDDYAGPLKIVAIATAFGTKWLPAKLTEFSALYPKITLEIFYDDKKSLELSMANTGIYVGFTYTEPRDSMLYVAKELCSYPLYPYASLNYIAQHGEPKTLEEMARHRLIIYKFGPTFSFLKQKKVNPLYMSQQSLVAPVMTDDATGALSLAEEGLGIAMLPQYMMRRSSLVRLLEGIYDPEKGETYKVLMVYPEHLKEYKRIKAIKEFVFKKAREDKQIFS